MTLHIGGCVALALVLLGFAIPAAGQSRPFEINIGYGYAAAEGEPPPDLPTIVGGFDLKVSRHLALGVDVSIGIGQRPAEEPLGTVANFPRTAGDRRSLSSGRLVHNRVLVQYRVNMSERVSALLGAGLMSGSFQSVDLVAASLTDVITVRTNETWGGVAFRALLKGQLLDRLAVGGGITIDTAFDRTYVQPAIVCSIGF